LARFKSIDPQRISTISAKTESIRKRVEELTQRNLASVLVDVKRDTLRRRNRHRLYLFIGAWRARGADRQ
jgi:hypothetical protein